MKILALEKEIPGNSPQDFQQYLRDEARHVWELQKAGVIREIYFARESHEAVIILECDSTEEAQQYLNALPLVQHDLITFRLLVLDPYTGFERLLD